MGVTTLFRNDSSSFRGPADAIATSGHAPSCSASFSVICDTPGGTQRFVRSLKAEGHRVGGGRGVYYVEDVAEALWHEAHVGCLAPHEEEESDVDHVTAVAAAAAAASASTPGEKGWGYTDTGGEER